MRRPQSPPVVTDVRVTAHFAHDLRNLLAAVLGHTELQLGELGPERVGSSLERSLRAIHLTAAKATSICEEMVLGLRAAVLPPSVPERFPLAEVARSAAEVVQARAGGCLRVDLDGSDEVLVLADRSRLERAVLNLLWNAQDATLSVSAAGGAVVTRWGEDSAGPWLEVADRGPGLPEGRLRDLAEPFRSGQDGDGRAADRDEVRGIGLSAVLDTMRRCGGRLRGRNAPGGGAVVRLEFPPARSAARNGELPGYQG